MVGSFAVGTAAYVAGRDGDGPRSSVAVGGCGRGCGCGCGWCCCGGRFEGGCGSSWRACSVERGAWSVGGLGACRGCEKTARWGRSDAERGCGQAPPTREGVGERGEGRGARARLFHCEPVWPIAGRLEASCLLGWAFAFVGRQKYKSKSTVRRRARQHLLMDAAEKASANQKTHGTGQLTAPQDFVKSHFVTNDFSPDIHVVYTVHGTVGAHTGILCRL